MLGFKPLNQTNDFVKIIISQKKNHCYESQVHYIIYKTWNLHQISVRSC